MRALWFVTLVVLGSACMSNPDEILPIRGSVVSNAPVVGQPVLVRRKIQPFSTGSRGPCLADQSAPVIKETQVEADGGYRFRVFRAEGQPLGTLGQFCFRVETTFPSGSSAWSELSNALSLDNPIAPFPEWPVAPGIDGGVLVFEPAIPMPPDFFQSFTEFSSEVQLDHTLEFVSDAGLIWKARDVREEVVDGGRFFRRESLRLGDAFVEDFAGEVRLRATITDLSLRGQYLFYENALPPVQVRPARDLALQGTRVPFTRGLACPPFEPPCPFTDGVLDRVDAGQVTRLSLEVSPPREVEVLVLRDVALFGAAIEVELALEDGGVWSVEDKSVGSTDFNFEEFALVTKPDGGLVPLLSGYRAIGLDAGAPVQRVILKFPYGLARMRELSIF
ncbi:MAG: hypothetical protein JNM17_13535 [Archangium sp.]|nr:hypothetical protein [Archangium sp.]